MKKIICDRVSLVFLISIYCMAAISLTAQTSSVLTDGLDHPNKIVTGVGNSLLVSEAGSTSPNTGRISVVDQVTGFRRTLIEGLPSAVSFLGGPAGDADGPSGIVLKGLTLYVTIGVGDAVVPGPGQGLELPNPGTPASPLFDSVLEVNLPRNYSSLASGFTITASEQASLAGGVTVTLANAQGRTISIRMISNLPDYIAAPRPGNPNNVKASHLYGVEIFQRNLYIVDAGHNLIHSVDINTGAHSVLTVFPDRPNPLFPTLGGPFIEAVPDSVHRWGNRLLVTFLTGFPFIPGMAEVRSVGLKNERSTGVIPNLTSAIDVIRVGEDPDLKEEDGDDGEGNAYYTLEFSTNQLGQAPGRLRYYSDPLATPVDLGVLLITPTSMARNGDNGSIYVTNTAPGTIIKVVVP